MDVTIPNLGDIDDVEVIEICVAVGDVVAENDSLVVIESDKASMDIPSPVAGTVESIQVQVGDQVTEGHVIATVVGADAGESETQSESEPESESEAIADTPSEPASEPAPDPSAESPTEAPAEAPAEAQELDVLVPDIGDASGVVVIEIAVEAGDVIAVNDLLVVLESDKASMEIAAEHAGTVLEVAVSVDQEVSAGSLIARVRTDAPVEKAAPEAAKPTAAATASPSEKAQPPAEQKDTPKAPDAPDAAGDDAAGDAKVYAGPATRRLARELGVSLAKVKGTGSRERITKDDVKAYVKQQMATGKSSAHSAAGLPQVAEIDFAKFGPVENLALTRIQQRGADNLHRSWVNLPHVTQHDETDITDLEAFRQSLKQEAERKGIKITPLAFIVKACCHALLEFPNFNSSLHSDRKQLVLKHYINIGLAVDTPEGLVVPVIKAANEKSIWQLSLEIAELSDKARNKKLAMDDLQGGTFSVSSLGALGGTGFTPIINAPEVAILGVSKLQTKPLWDGESFVPRKVLPLSLSYDHRVINGADGGRFMNYLTTALADIRRLAL